MLKEEFVSDMVPKLRYAAMKDVPTMYRKEEFVSGTVHHGQGRLVPIKDVLPLQSEEGYV